nr:VOC family protein [Halothiobacillus sp.]
MTATKPIPDGQQTITPYLSVHGADAAIQFYQRIFGATEIGRLLMPGGDIGHAELQIDNARFMLAEENPAWGNKSPTTLGGTPLPSRFMWMMSIPPTNAHLTPVPQASCPSRMSFTVRASVYLPIHSVINGMS